MPVALDPSKQFNPSMRMDAGESAFFLRELESIKAQTYDVKYKQLKAFELIPISGEANTGATEITWRQFAAVGLAKVVQDYALDFPEVDVYGIENTVKVQSIGDGYGYSVQEIRASVYAGKRLDQRKAEAARRASDEKVNTIALTGDTLTGMQGLVNYPGITAATIPADGTSSSKTWASKTAAQIIRDVTNLVNAVVATTNGREFPDTLLLPLTQFNDISTRQVNTYNDTTVLEYILKTSPYIKTIDFLVELTAAGAGATDRALLYARDPLHLTLEIPQPFEQFDPQIKGMRWFIPCHQRTAGVIVYYPLSISYGDGI